MTANRGGSLAGYEGNAAELAEEITRIVRTGSVRASYGADERLREHHRSERLVSIAVINSDLSNRESAEIERIFGLIADAAARWLRQRQILTAGTLISIHLAREVDLRIVSWGWGTGGRNFWIDGDGRPTTTRPEASAPDESHS